MTEYIIQSTEHGIQKKTRNNGLRTKSDKSDDSDRTGVSVRRTPTVIFGLIEDSLEDFQETSKRLKEK